MSDADRDRDKKPGAAPPESRHPAHPAGSAADQIAATRLRGAACFAAFVTTLLDQPGGCQHCTTVTAIAMLIASRCDATGQLQAELLAEVMVLAEQFAQKRRGEVLQ